MKPANRLATPLVESGPTGTNSDFEIMQTDDRLSVHSLLRRAPDVERLCVTFGVTA